MNWQEHIKGKRSRRLICNYLNAKKVLRDKRKYRKFIRKIAKELSLTHPYYNLSDRDQENRDYYISRSILSRAKKWQEFEKIMSIVNKRKMENVNV